MKLARCLLTAILLVTVNSTSLVAQSSSTPETLRRLADDYYKWRNENYPVASSDAGLHAWDTRGTDYSLAAVMRRRAHLRELLARLNLMKTSRWGKDDQIDWLLFRAQLEGVAFFDRVMSFETTDPQLYVNECSNGIFSLLKKDYDTARNRAVAATARMKQMPTMIEQGRRNLTSPVKLYAQLAIDSARSIDGLFNDSLGTIAKELRPGELAEHVKARDAAFEVIATSNLGR